MMGQLHHKHLFYPHNLLLFILVLLPATIHSVPQLIQVIKGEYIHPLDTSTNAVIYYDLETFLPNYGVKGVGLSKRWYIGGSGNDGGSGKKRETLDRKGFGLKNLWFGSGDATPTPPSVTSRRFEWGKLWRGSGTAGETTSVSSRGNKPEWKKLWFGSPGDTAKASNRKSVSTKRFEWGKLWFGRGTGGDNTPTTAKPSTSTATPTADGSNGRIEVLGTVGIRAIKGSPMTPEVLMKDNNVSSKGLVRCHYCH